MFAAIVMWQGSLVAEPFAALSFSVDRACHIEDQLAARCAKH